MARNGTKTGGRKKGTPNKKTGEMLDVLGDYCPLEKLLEIAQSDDVPLDVKVKINLDLLPYIYPKRKSIELTDGDYKPPVFTINGVKI